MNVAIYWDWEKLGRNRLEGRDQKLVFVMWSLLVKWKRLLGCVFKRLKLMGEVKA